MQVPTFLIVAAVALVVVYVLAEWAAMTESARRRAQERARRRRHDEMRAEADEFEEWLASTRARSEAVMKAPPRTE